MTTVSGTPCQITVRTQGIQGAPGTIAGSPALATVLGTDLIPVLRGQTLYLATVAAVLAAAGISPTGSRFDFSVASNSGLLGAI